MNITINQNQFFKDLSYLIKEWQNQELNDKKTDYDNGLAAGKIVCSIELRGIALEI